uniref:PE family protein n=1 Tax=Mycobacterium sp. Marseille-P9652 TaxID=2654950 RepID=UPI0012E8E400|nr:PE family protein [Mycobacterium sp. Marseille-P9652]
MSYVVAAPEYVAAAAHDLANIGSSIRSANAAALAPTSSVVAAGADEVSATITALFEAHAQVYQAISAQAALFHEQFVQLMTGGAVQYAAAEAANASPLQTVEQAALTAVSSAGQVGSSGAVPAAAAGPVSGSTPLAPAAGLVTGVSPESAVPAAVASAGVSAPAVQGGGSIYAQLVRELGYEPLASGGADLPAGASVEAVAAETAEFSGFSPASALPLAGTPLGAAPATRAYTPATPAYSPGSAAAAEEQPAG